MNSRIDLQKMLLISPKVFENLKHMLSTSEKTKEIDDSLKKVLNNTKMNDQDKWSLYRHNQFHLANIKRKNNYGVKPQTLRKIIKGSKTSTDVSTNTKQKFSKSAETDMRGFVPSKNAQTQSDVASSGALPEKIYENSFYESFSEPNNLHDANAEAEAEYDVNNQTLDYSDIARDQALLGKPRNVRIISVLQSRDPKRFKLYELSDGTDAEIPIPQKENRKADVKLKKAKKSSPNRPLKKSHKNRSTPKKKGSYNDDPEWLPYS